MNPISNGKMMYELVSTLEQINSQIASRQEYCVSQGIDINKLCDQYGNSVMIPLYAAKAQVLFSMTLLDIPLGSLDKPVNCSCFEPGLVGGEHKDECIFNPRNLRR